MFKDLLLIPGSLSTSELWHQNIDVLQKQFTNIHHMDVCNSNSITDMAKRHLSSAPEKFSIVSFSMGGYIALELFQFIPDHIENFVIINGGARELCQRGKDERQRSVELVEKGRFDFLVNRIFKNSIDNEEKQAAIIPLLKKMAYEIGPENYVKQLRSMINKHEQEPLLSKITCPTLIITAKKDRVMPNERAEHMANHIANAELVYLEDCGHMAMLEQPEKINQLLINWFVE
ncbi:alpha/beta fold hydrolase [Legionella yabuuchiae]|uniref:alpha/beta fold hydrolase n=1 Tax=Legionella yabuuchiae TaxID=376727 RepID=UPI0010559796|nr:alpha/beta hydrolase [Legionella yabuuchiae]